MRKILLYLFLFITFLSVQAQVLKDFEFDFGGALRFSYNYSDWKPGHKKRGGDFGYDVLVLKFDASWRNLIMAADYRFYSTDYGGGMLKYGWIGYRFNEKQHLELGLTRQPFGIQPYGAHNFFFQLAYYVGLEDDSDMGVKYVFEGRKWDFALAFYKNADELLFGDHTETSNDRYGYDIAGRNKEINQVNGYLNYKFGTAVRHHIGASGLFGGIYNLDTEDTGTRFAFAVHYELFWKQLTLKTQVATYAMYPKNKQGEPNDVISMTAYGAPYLIAAKNNLYQAGAGWSFPVKWGPISAVQIYTDFGWLQKWNKNFKDSYQLVPGCLITAGPVYTYIDYVMGKRHAWLGPDWNSFAGEAQSNQWHARLNVNIGYYF